MTAKPNPDAERNSKRYYALLVSVMALTAFSPMIEHQIFGRFIIGALAISALITATLATGAKRLARAALLLAIFTSIIWASSLFSFDNPLLAPQLQSVAYGLTFLFVALISFIMMKDIFTNEVTGNRVAGAICVYVLIGFAFAIIHMLTLTHDPLAYKDSSAPELTSSGTRIAGSKVYPLFVYFSFCTLSTVGYGDIVPVSRVARTMSWLEAVIGQIYLTVLVARLVGLHIAAASNSGAARDGSNKDASATVPVTEAESRESKS